MKTITVEVTAEDIANGVKGKCTSCPVARALSRAAGEPWSVAFDYATRERDCARAWLTPKCRTFIEDFDCGEPVAPFSFTIEVPE